MWLQEEAQLEAEIEAIGSRLDEELLQEQEQAAVRQQMGMLAAGPATARMADGPAGPSGAARSRPVSAGHR